MPRRPPPDVETAREVRRGGRPGARAAAVTPGAFARTGRGATGTRVGPRTPVHLAAAHAMAGCSEATGRALAGAGRGAVEGIHDVRTSTRRARAAVGAFHDELRPSERRALRSVLRGVRRAASPLRDLDVLHEALEHARLPLASERGRRALLSALEHRRATALAAFRRTLTGPALAAVAAQLLRAAARVARTASTVPLAVAGATRLPAALSPVLARRARLGNASARAPAPELHALRIDVKRARYAAEAFAPAFGRPLERFALDARRLQDRLGALQDAELCRAGLADLLPRVPGAARPAATLVADRLAAASARAARRAREEVPELLEAAFGPKRLRTLYAHLGKRAALAAAAGVLRGAGSPR